MKLIVNALADKKHPEECSRSCPYLDATGILYHCILFDKSIGIFEDREDRLPECIDAEIKE